jgi:transcriptional adapter 2-alpha
MLDVTAEMIPHMECQECKSPKVENTPLKLCLACFSNPEKHSWSHPYIVIRDMDLLPSPIPIPLKAWTQRQDFALLNGVEKLGFGNWEEISTVALRKSQTPDACKKRFEQFRVLLGETPQTEEDRTKEDLLFRQKAQSAMLLPGAGLVGYQPLREEFETVFANDAELIIADMVFGNEDEDPHEKGQEWKDLKLRVLRNYNLKVDIRESRKRYVLDKGLLDFQKIQDIRKKVAHQSTDILADLEILARFSGSVQEHEKFEKGILKERALRDEIRKLQQYRAMGIRTFDEIDSYNRQAAKRHEVMQFRKQQQQQQTAGLSSSSSSGIVLETTAATTTTNATLSNAAPLTAPSISSSSTIPVETEQDVQAKSYLTAEELQLLESIHHRLTPIQYLVVKECILREAAKNGGCVSKPQAVALLTVEMTVVEHLYDFFIKCEWIKRLPVSPAPTIPPIASAVEQEATS